ncbi:hypothetical protein [Stenotrophomonas phage RAS14]
MNLLQELNEQNQLARLEMILNYQEAELQSLIESDQPIMVNEQDENMLNRIFDDIDARFADARNALADANRSRGDEKRQKMSTAMGDMNKIRNILDQMLKKYFPKDDGSQPQRKPLDHMISPKEAADALGVHPSRIQNLVSSGKLRMHNDNGRWALRGQDVQALIDAQG